MTRVGDGFQNVRSLSKLKVSRAQRDQIGQGKYDENCFKPDTEPFLVSS